MDIKQTDITQQWINYLNELFKIDKEAISKLVESRVSCNDGICDHPNVQVTMDGKLGFVGLINGFLISNGLERIAYSEDDDGKILGFVKYVMQKN
jgi:hypothetical protein